MTMPAEEIAKILINCFRSENKVLICGNGGSAAQGQHFSGELMCKYKDIRKPLPVICLSTDTSVLTSIANDFGYQYVFSRQVEALGNKGDVLLCLTTSGNSANVLEAERVAEKKGMVTLRLPLDGQSTPEIQELHLRMLHEICGLVEEAIVKKEL